MAHIVEEIETNTEMNVSMEDIEQCLYCLNQGEDFSFIIDDQNNEVRQYQEEDDRPKDIILIITVKWYDETYGQDNWTPSMLKDEIHYFAEQFAKMVTMKSISTYYTVMWR